MMILPDFSIVIDLICKFGFYPVLVAFPVIVMLACMNGIKCLLRSEMLQIYYACEAKGEIRQYQLENFHRMYRAYKLLLGNSFIYEIRGKVITWRVIT